MGPTTNRFWAVVSASVVRVWGLPGLLQVPFITALMVLRPWWLLTVVFLGSAGV